MSEQQKPQSAVAWFEIPTLDLERARRFYEVVLNRDLIPYMDVDESMYIFPGEPAGVRGALVHREDHKPTPDGTLVYLSCEALDDSLARAEPAGGSVTVPRTPVPGGFGFFACLRDTEGNAVGLHANQ